MRSGHTEAAIDLCALAGLSPVAVICELANDDGTVMIGPQIAAFAERNGLKRISVADLIAHRQAREKLVERIGVFPVKTPIGELQGYAYRTPFDAVLHFAFVHGSVGDGRGVPARLHRCDIVNDVFGAGTIPKVLQRFKEEGRGILVYLRDGSAGVPVKFVGSEPGESDRQRDKQWREVGLGRPDPARPRRVVDPAQDQPSPNLCRPIRLRHRDRVGRADRRLRRPHPAACAATRGSSPGGRLLLPSAKGTPVSRRAMAAG